MKDCFDLVNQYVESRWKKLKTWDLRIFRRRGHCGQSLSLEPHFPPTDQVHLGHYRKKNLAIYLDWQKLVLVVLGEGGGGALSQQVVIVQQDSDIVEDLRLIIVQTTSFVHQPLPRQTPQVVRAAGNSSPLAPVSTDEACWNISDFG